MERFKLLVAPLLFCASQSASEETQTGEVLSLTKQLSELHTQLDGKTITLTGGLGTFIGDRIYFLNDLGRFEVQFDAGREARRLIEGCQINPWGDTEARCLFEVDAELMVSESYSLADGGEVKLIVYDVRQ